jgi:hypothetical protein
MPRPIIQFGTFDLRPYTVTELANIYGVCRQTFRKWIHPFEDVIGDRHGYFYSAIQVQIIIEKIGLPVEISIENKQL